MAIGFSKRTWVNGGAPALNATNLQAMDDGIQAAADSVDALKLGTTVGTETTLDDTDNIVVQDAEDSYKIKLTTVAELWTALWTKLGALIAGGTDKATPVDADTLALSDSAASGATKKLTWANIKSVLATAFKHGGSNEIATATPGPNVIPKTGAGSTLAAGFLPQATSSAIGGALLGANGGAIKDTKMPDGATAVYSQDAWATVDGFTSNNGTYPTTVSGGEIISPVNGSGYSRSWTLANSAGKLVLIRIKLNSSTPVAITFELKQVLGSWTGAVTTNVNLTSQYQVVALQNGANDLQGIRISGSLLEYRIDWIWIGDYSYLDGSLSEEAARFANEGGDAPGTPVAAVGTITATDVATATKGDTIGGKKYTFVASLTASPGVEGEVLKGATKEDDLENLNLAISEAGRASNGTKYWAAAIHPLVSSTRSGAILNLTARTPGILGNQITVVCESGTNHTASGSTLSGGLGAGGAKIISMVGNNIAGGGTRPAAARIDITNNGLIGFEDEVDKAVGATLTFPAGGVWIWFVHGYGSNVGGNKKGSSSGGATITMAGANGSIWYRKFS